jgi:hypothetical protein
MSNEQILQQITANNLTFQPNVQNKQNLVSDPLQILSSKVHFA